MISHLEPDDAKVMKQKEDAMLAGEDHMTHTATEFTKQDFDEHYTHYEALTMDNLTEVMFIGSDINKGLAKVCHDIMLDAKLLLPDVKNAKLIYFMSSVLSNCEVVDETNNYFYDTDDSDEEDDNDAKRPADGRCSGGVGIAARRHVITKVINQQSVTFWFYKINILHGNNNDSRNHFLTIERLLDALSETTPEIHINNKKSGGGAYTGEFRERINDY